MKKRIEKDSLGEIEVPAHALWGAQTQRSMENFPKETETMPKSLLMALVNVKKASAKVNNDEGKLSDDKKDLINYACNQILLGNYNDQFPLSIWQTGSGTQTNMNANEVIANLANKKAGEKVIHPNDHVNMSQSSNDVFPTAMHVASFLNLKDNLFPEIEGIIESLYKKENEFDLIKTGRTHLQDATPIRLSQEISAWRVMVERDYEILKTTSQSLRKLAIGGTAVGTGLNASETFGANVAKELSALLDTEFISDTNKFYQLSSKTALVASHGAIKTLASDLYKIANDIRFLSCGPRSGISELNIPANEPGSSIMPGKVNPTQVESLTMVAIQIMANDFAITMANSGGQLQLNAYMPLIIYNMDQSINLLAKSLKCFRENLLEGLSPNKENIDKNLENSLMLVTALSPRIGYDKASELAKYAFDKGLTLKEANRELGFLDEEEFDKLIDPSKMV